MKYTVNHEPQTSLQEHNQSLISENKPNNRCVDRPFKSRPEIYSRKLSWKLSNTFNKTVSILANRMV